jgi:hypothetical protein
MPFFNFKRINILYFNENRDTQTLISTIKADTALINESYRTLNPSSLETGKEPEYNDELNIIKSSLFNLHKHYQKLKLRFYKLHEDYLKINEVAEILTISLENSVQGQPVHLDMILQSCFKIFPNRFNKKTQTTSEVVMIFFYLLF